MIIEYNDSLKAYVAGQIVGDEVKVGTGFTHQEAMYHCIKKIMK